MTVLERIVKAKRAEVAGAKARHPVVELRREIAALQPPRDFYAAVTEPARHGIRLIAEVKKASPSAGVIVPDFDPVSIARTYARFGAAALSVLTDEAYFQGRLEHIARIKSTVELPVLRKDFLFDEYQVYESRAVGADAVLLIAEVLEPDELTHLHDVTRKLAMSALIEVHSETNLARVLDRFGAPGPDNYLLGINNRDLHAQRTDVHTTVRLASRLPPATPFISESGLAARGDVDTVRDAGACAILVGESLLKADDIGAKMRELLGS